MILALQQGLKADGIEVSLVKLCRWFGMPRRSACIPALQGGTKTAGAFRSTNQGHDQGTPLIRLPYGDTPAADEENTVQRVFSRLQQEFITPYSPEQNGMLERVIRTLNYQCVHRHHLFRNLAAFESRDRRLDPFLQRSAYTKR